MAEATGHGLDGPSPAADSPASRVDSSILLQNSREPGRHAEIFVLTRTLYTVGLMFWLCRNRVVGSYLFFSATSGRKNLRFFSQTELRKSGPCGAV